MARVWVVLALLTAVGAGWGLPALAGDGEASKGTKEVVFSFDYWYLGSYNGGVGLRYFLKDDVAVRPGFDIRIEDDSYDGTDRYDRDLNIYTTDRKVGALGFSVFLEKYAGEVRNLRPFLAVGLAYGYSSSDEDYDRSDLSDYGVERYYATSYDRTQHSASLIWGFGLQWHFTDRLSLGGQYNLSVEHSWVDRTDSGVRYDGHDSQVWTDETSEQHTDINIDSGRLLLSLQF